MTPEDNVLAAPDVQPIEEEAAAQTDHAQIVEGMDVGQPSIAELLEHQRLAAASSDLVTSERCIHVRIANREEQQAVAEQRADLAARARAEGMTLVEVQAAIDTLAPLPPTRYEICPEDESGDVVLVHAGHTITARELERFGLTAEHITAASAAPVQEEEAAS